MSENVDPRKYFHQEVSEQLLSWVSPVTLVRCAVVCKMWLNIVKNKDFLILYGRRSRNLHKTRYIKSSNENGEYRERLTIHMDDESLGVIEEIRIPFQFTFYSDFISCCNGVFLITNMDYKTHSLVLWNPTIGRYALIPTAEIKNDFSESRDYSFGLYFSCDDYKVIIVFYYYLDAAMPSHAQIFSLNSGAWSKFRKQLPNCHLFNSFGQVLVNNCLHWFGRDSPNMIVCFDIEDEAFFQIALPSEVLGNRIVEPIVLRECLGIYTRLKDEIQIWIMCNYDDIESWKPLIKLNFHLVGIFGVRMTEQSHVELFHKPTTGRELYCFNCSINANRKVGIDCSELPHMGLYTESMGLYFGNKYSIKTIEDMVCVGRPDSDLGLRRSEENNPDKYLDKLQGLYRNIKNALGEGLGEMVVSDGVVKQLSTKEGVSKVEIARTLISSGFKVEEGNTYNSGDDQMPVLEEADKTEEADRD